PTRRPRAARRPPPRPAPGLTAGGRHGLQRGAVARPQGEPRAARGEAQRNGLADALRGTGHHDRAPGRAAAHGLLRGLASLFAAAGLAASAAVGRGFSTPSQAATREATSTA